MSTKMRHGKGCDGRCELDRATANWEVALCSLNSAIREQEALRRTVLPLQPMGGAVADLLAAYRTASSLYRERLSRLTAKNSLDTKSVAKSTRPGVSWSLERSTELRQGGQGAGHKVASHRILQSRAFPSRLRGVKHTASRTLQRRTRLWEEISNDYIAWLNMTDQLRAAVEESGRVRSVMSSEQKEAFQVVMGQDVSVRKSCLDSVVEAWGTTCGPSADKWCDFTYNDGVTVEKVPPPVEASFRR